MNKLTLKPKEVAALLRMSESSVYNAIRRGEIPSVRIGKLLVVPWSALQQLLHIQAKSSLKGENGK